MIQMGCIDGGLFCIGVPVLIISIFFPALGVKLKKKFFRKQCGCKCDNEVHK